MNPVSTVKLFPEEIRNVLISNKNPNQRSKEIETLFRTNVNVLSNYRTWAKSHSSLIRHNQELCDINFVYTKIHIYNIIKIGFLSSIIASVCNKVYIIAANFFEWLVQDFSYTSKYVLDQYDCGIISADSCIHSTNRDVSGLVQLFRPYSGAEELQILCAMKFERLKELLSVRTGGYSMIDRPFVMQYIATHFIDKLTNDQIKELLSIDNYDGCTPLHYDNTLLLALPFLNKLPSTDVKTLLLKKNKLENTPLISTELIYNDANDQGPTLFSILNKLSAADIKDVFAVANAKGYTPLHNEKILKHSLPLLEKLSTEERKNLLLLKDNNNLTVFESGIKVFKLAHDDGFLKHLSDDDIVKLFSIRKMEKNPTNQTFIHNEKNAEVVFSLMTKLPVEYQKKILLLRDNRGHTVLEVYLKLRMINQSDITNIFGIDFKPAQVFLTKTVYDQNFQEVLDRALRDWFGVCDFEIVKTIKGIFCTPESPLKKFYHAFIFGFHEQAAFAVKYLKPKDQDAFFKKLSLEPELVKEIFKTRTSTVGQRFIHKIGLLKDFIPLLKKLSVEDVKEILAIKDETTRENGNFINTLKYGLERGLLDKNILNRIYGVDFDYTQNISQDYRAANLKLDIKQWLDIKISKEQAAEAIVFVNILGFKDIIKERLGRVSKKDIQILYKIYPDFDQEFGLDLALAGYTIRAAHMKEGPSINAGVPKAVDMSLIPLVDEPLHVSKNKQYKYFYSFIKNFIDAAVKDGEKANVPLSHFVYHTLLKMNDKITKNEFFTGANPNPIKRKEDYQNFCCYLSNVFADYKIGQSGGDIASKNKVLELLANASTSCFPGWMQEVKQIYAFRPTNGGVANRAPLTLKDRLLMRLRAERIDILSMKLVQAPYYLEGEPIHESNGNLNLFREEFGTKLELIDDFYAHLAYKDIKRSNFYEFYNIQTLIQSLYTYLNQQTDREGSTSNELDLSLNEVDEWLRDADCATTWRPDCYDDLLKTVNNYKIQNMQDADIALFLAGLGFEWRWQEESVEDALIRLDSQSGALKRSIDSYPIIARELGAIALITDEKAQSVELMSFISRQKSIIKHVNADVNEVRNAINAWNSANKTTHSLLKGIQKEIASLQMSFEELEEKLETTENDEEKIAIQNEIKLILDKIKPILVENDRILKVQPLEELLKPGVIKRARANDFIKSEIYNSKGKFTLKGVVHLLESAGVIQRKTNI